MRTAAFLTIKDNKPATYEHHANYWLANGNEAEEKGEKAKAERCFQKAQYWLDRYNKAVGNA
jgi:hypothetical protein